MKDTKRQRLANDNAAEHLAKQQPSAELGLPEELWANVFQFLYLDEALKCSYISRFFTNHVMQQVKVLHVRSGDSMNAVASVLERFISVECVHINLIRELTHGIAGYHLDRASMRYAVPFLSELPKLKKCHLGCNTAANWRGEYYDVCRENEYDEPNSNNEWAKLIHSVCIGYKTGKISNHVEFTGLIPDGHPSDGCAWKSIPKVECYRDDVPCQTCDMICTSFPPSQVLDLSLNSEVLPCITFENLVKLVRYRDYEQSQSNMTNAIISTLDAAEYCHFMSPPDYVTKTCTAMHFYDYHFERIRCFIRNGADPKDPAILKSLLNRKYDWRDFLKGKRIIELKLYNTLKSLGLDMNETNFVTIDESDKRSDINKFKGRKAKSELHSGVALSDIKSIRGRVKRTVTSERSFIDGRFRNGKDLSVKEIQRVLEEWLEVDLSDHEDDINLLMLEFRKLPNSEYASLEHCLDLHNS